MMPTRHLFLIPLLVGRPSDAPMPEVQALLDQGRAAEQAAQSADATRLYQQARTLARERQDRAGEAAALIGLGRAVIYETPLESITHFKQALPIYRERGDRAGEALCLLLLGNAAQISSQPPKALAYYGDAEKILQALGNRRALATVQSNAATIFLRTGRPLQAIERLLPPLQIYQEEKDAAGRLRTLGNLGAAYRDAWEIPRALEVLKQARTLAQELGSKHDEGIVLLNLGLSHARVGDFSAAMTCYAGALPLLEAAGDQRTVGAVFTDIAEIHESEGDLLAALTNAGRALTIHQAVGDQNGIATTLLALGWLRLRVGQAAQARESFQAALEASRKAEDASLEALVLTALGRFHSQRDQPRLAQRFLERSLALHRDKGLDDGTRATALLHLSGSLLQTKDYAGALARCQEAYALFRKVGDAPGEAAAETTLATAKAGLGQSAAARGHYQRAIAFCLDRRMTQDAAEASARLGALEEQQGRLAAAATHYRRAIDLQEGVRGSLGDLTEAKVGYLERHLMAYRRYLGLLLRAGKSSEAFDWAQKAKARVLIDQMAVGATDLGPTMTAADRGEERRLNVRSRELSRQWMANQALQEEMGRWGTSDRSREATARRQAREILRQFQDLDRDWRTLREGLCVRSPHLADRRVVRTATLAQIGAMLPPDTALLEFVTLHDQIGLFVVTASRGAPRVTALGLGPADAKLAGQIAALRQACAGRPGTGAERLYQPLARQLYRRLIAPARAAFTGKRRLILCPDGVLWNVPFPALLDGDAFLWERFELIFAHSATAMRAARDVRGRPGRPRALQTMLVVADPDAGASASGALPHARAEAAAIQASVAGAVVRLGEMGQESRVRSEARNFHYLHFATHALFNDVAPLLSGVVLARPPKDSPDDGILTARELMGQNLAADLLTLSACETGRGVSRPGEGLLGLTWAAFVAGVPSQVVSQWSVDDAATAQLMAAFYRHLKVGKGKDEALREACLALRRDSVHAHPFYWSAFFLVGDWR